MCACVYVFLGCARILRGVMDSTVKNFGGWGRNRIYFLYIYLIYKVHQTRKIGLMY